MNNNEEIRLSETRRAYRKFASQIDKIIKDEIRRQGLVKTGKMIGSIKCKVSMGSMQQMNVDVDAVDYFKYVNGNFSILNNAFNSSRYQTILIEFRKFVNRYNR